MNLPVNEEELNKLIDKRIKLARFTQRRLIDTPTDSLAVVPRKYVNMYGSVASRPQNSVLAQFYFNTTVGYPMWRNTNNAWVSATGSVVG